MNENRRKVIERMTKLIRTGDIVDGRGKLPTERELCDLLGVGRTLLREAIISLEATGVLEIRERQGIFIAEKDKMELPPKIGLAFLWPMETLGQVMEIREIIEGKVAYLAALRRTDEDIEKLESCLRMLRGIFSEHRRDEAEQGAYWNTILHNTIFRATHNSILARIHENITDLMEKSIVSMRMQILDSNEPGRTELILGQHERLVRAILEKDPFEAIEAAESHLAYTFSILEEQSKVHPFSDLLTRRFDVKNK